MAFSLLPFTKGIGDIPRLNNAAGDPQLRVARLFWSPGPSTITGSLSPYALRGSLPWGHHFPSDCCPVYLRWPTGPLWWSFWSTGTLTNTRRGGNLGRRTRCSPPVADTLKAFPQNPPQTSSIPRRQPASHSQEGETRWCLVCWSWHLGLLNWLQAAFTAASHLLILSLGPSLLISCTCSLFWVPWPFCRRWLPVLLCPLLTRTLAGPPNASDRSETMQRSIQARRFITRTRNLG